MKGTIRGPGSGGASALVPYSIVGDEGAPRAVHEAGLDERHRRINSNHPYPVSRMPAMTLVTYYLQLKEALYLQSLHVLHRTHDHDNLTASMRP